MKKIEKIFYFFVDSCFRRDDKFKSVTATRTEAAHNAPLSPSRMAGVHMYEMELCMFMDTRLRGDRNVRIATSRFLTLRGQNAHRQN